MILFAGVAMMMAGWTLCHVAASIVDRPVTPPEPPQRPTLARAKVHTKPPTKQPVLNLGPGVTDIERKALEAAIAAADSSVL